MKLLNKAAIVTGGGQGIGKAICLAFAREGADVMVADLNPVSAAEVSSEILASGRKSRFFQFDVADSTQVREMIEAAVAFLGRIDILVNSAGIFKRSAVEEISEKDWDRVMAVNLKGTLLCCQAAGTQLIRQGGGGVIVNVASMAAHIPQPYSGAYSASKAAVVILSQMMALEWARHGIRVNAVSPGSVLTPLLRSVYETEEAMTKRARSIPLSRLAQPEEVAAAVVFLACDESSFVTGHDLHVDGASSISHFYLLSLLDS